MPLSRASFKIHKVHARSAYAFARRRPHAHRGEHDHHHGHDHKHHSHHHHDHDHGHADDQTPAPRPVQSGAAIVIRPSSGLSGDMMLAGLACMAGMSTKDLGAIASLIGLPQDCVSLERRGVNNVFGWGCRVSLPDIATHRTWSDIRKLIADSGMSAKAKQLANQTFGLLADAEGTVHSIPASDVHFHEVGALDSILDICVCAELFAQISPTQFVCGPLPLCDGTVKCEHGLLPTPAPAVFELLKGVPVRGIPSEGETVTPTAIALLKGLGAQFGEWPEITIERTALVYGGRVLPGIANGALFALGSVSGVVAV